MNTIWISENSIDICKSFTLNAIARSGNDIKCVPLYVFAFFLKECESKQNVPIFIAHI